MSALRAAHMLVMPNDMIEEIIDDIKGVTDERADLSTSTMIEELLPHGDIFLAGLLNNAVIQTYTHLPTHPLVEKAAVLSLNKGYEELSQMLSMTYDTTHSYVLICRALGLLKMKSVGKQTTIIIPLGPYRPPTELREILQELKSRYSDRRPKVRRLIERVIERIASILPIEQKACEQSYQDELLKRVQQGIYSQGIVDPDGQIAMNILAEIAPLVTKHVDVPTKPNKPGIAEYLPKYYAKSSHQQESSQHEIPGQEIATTKNLHFGSGNADHIKATDTPTKNATSSVSGQSRFLKTNLSSEKRLDGEVRENASTVSRFGLENLPCHQSSKASPYNISELADVNLLATVDSSEEILENGIGNGNTSQRNSNTCIPDPDQDVEIHAASVLLPIAHPTIRKHALTLAKLIEGSEKNIGAYVELLKKHDLSAIRAGVIETLRRKYFPGGRTALRAPGGYFTKRVQQFATAIPEQLAELLEAYAQSSYEEIEQALKEQAQAAHQQSGKSWQSRSRATCPARHGQPMDKGMARTLASRIRVEDPYVQVKDICKLDDGSYAVNVYIDPMDHTFYTMEEWDIYHAQMQALEQEASQ